MPLIEQRLSRKQFPVEHGRCLACRPPLKRSCRSALAGQIAVNVHLRGDQCYRKKLAINKEVVMMLPDRVCKVKSLYGFLIAIYRFLCFMRPISQFCTFMYNSTTGSMDLIRSLMRLIYRMRSCQLPATQARLWMTYPVPHLCRVLYFYPIATNLVSRYSFKPSGPDSLPTPLSFQPVNGPSVA